MINKKSLSAADLESIHKKFSDLEGYIEALKNSIRTIDQRVKKEFTLLNDNKADRHTQKDLEKETAMLKIKIDQVDLSLHHTKEGFDAKFGNIERDVLPTIQEKLKFQGDVVSINMNRVDKVESKLDTLNKIIAKISKEDFDLTLFDKMEDKIRRVENNINIWKDDFESMFKEIRNVLYLKADDESITELENKVLYKLNELVENIWKKFADKTETKIGLKNINSQIKELFNMLLIIPKDNDKDEDNAMLSKKPLGGVSCASWDKNIVNLQRCQSVEAIAWNQMPHRERAERFSKIGKFSKILSQTKSNPGFNTSYKSRIKKLGEISESMSEYNHSKIEDKLGHSEIHPK